MFRRRRGLIIRPNLVQKSQDLTDGTFWGVAGSAPPVAPTRTANTSDVLAPDGSSTATKCVFAATTGASQYSLIQQHVESAPATAYTFSAYMRGTGAQTFYTAIDGQSAGPQIAATFALTAAWQRVYFHWTSVAGATIYFNIGSDTRAGNGNEPNMSAQTVYIWGVQFNVGTFPTPYRPNL